MKSVAIITIQSINFGNRLQNYALQEVLKSYGYSVKTIRRGVAPSIKKRFKTVEKAVLHVILRSKGSKFESFERKINKSRYYVGANDAPAELKNKFDYFVVGSDQVWNPHYDFTGLSDLLSFANDSQKISYAASFGVGELPENCKELYCKNLKSFHGISVREASGKKIIKELLDRDVDVVLDPTLMLNASEWRKVEKSTNIRPKGKYAVVYALGTKSNLFLDKIEQIRNEGYEILDFFSKNTLGKEIAIGPSEFLYLIDNADFVLTDSFHATAFSILFGKRFMTFPREGLDMSSRIVTLAESTGLSKCFDANGVLKVNEVSLYMDTEKELKMNREKSKAFLDSNLGGGN